METIIPIVEQTGVLIVSTDGAYDLSTANGRMVAKMLCAAAQGEVETKARRNRDRSSASPISRHARWCSTAGPGSFPGVP